MNNFLGDRARTATRLDIPTAWMNSWERTGGPIWIDWGMHIVKALRAVGMER